jgi:AAA+ superfamily predicted ATPase
VSLINVLVVKASEDVRAEAIAKAIADSVLDRSDMNLVGSTSRKESGIVSVDEVADILQSIDPSTRSALVLVGSSADSKNRLPEWLSLLDDFAVMHVDVEDYMVQIGLRHSNLDSLLTALRQLVESASSQKRERVTRMQLREVKSLPERDTPPSSPASDGAPPHQVTPKRTLLAAAIKWIHALLQEAVAKIPKDNTDPQAFSLSRETVSQCLEELAQRLPDGEDISLSSAEADLQNEFDKVETNLEPLAVAVHELGLEYREFRLLALALAPELESSFQRCIGVLLDEVGRRVGTMGLYSTLLGFTPQVRGESINGGDLGRWLVLEGYSGRPAAADEPLRVDPFLAQWLLGHRKALMRDPRVRRYLRLNRWPGSSILKAEEERAAWLIDRIQSGDPAPWVLLDGNDSAGWRALVERGVRDKPVRAIRVVASRLAGVDLVEVEEIANLVGRLARLHDSQKRPVLIIDVTKTDSSEAEDDYLGLFLTTLDRARVRAVFICRDEARIVQLLGSAPYELITGPALSKAARLDAVREAARRAGISYLTQESAESIANRYPLQVDGLEQAMRLAASRPKNYDRGDPDLDRLTTALKELASEGVSHLVERIEPVFSLDEVILPLDRKQTLKEIVDQIRLAPRVLDGWKFREKLPYGRGVASLFFGPSGTGKTMAAMGISRELDIQILRLDLSRVVSKYIGETEKNLDRVFTDAQRSGAAILIDEADALLGKRSEVKDAHDRYANIEVAYLLQRLEAYEGLAILTTNMRKNLDVAFLRRLRFIVEFPRPDGEAREKIWRQCLPEESHELTNADFRQIARRIDLTGGQIRQITLRAAFIAAAAGTQIALEHIVQAASAELAKLGMPPIEVDLLRTRRAAA